MKSPKIITCASYCGSGSSAVTDLLGEFDNVFFMGDYEFRFIQDPDGVFDLANNVAENYHRHNSGYAIKRYKKYVDFLSGNVFFKKYEKFFDGQFRRRSYDYIDELTKIKFRGYWHRDVYDKGMFFYILERITSHIVNKLRGGGEDAVLFPFMKSEVTYVPKDDKALFYKITRKYIDDLFTIANKDNSKYIMVDQLVPPNNCNRYLRLFNDIKIIAVDRDPRDLYILEKTKWKGSVIPTSNVYDYCKWIRETRKHRFTESDDTQKVLRIYLEDMIYHYDKTVNKICNFLGIDMTSHTRPFSHFIPEQSINNTRLWVNHPELIKDIRIIEENLSDYCYNNYNS